MNGEVLKENRRQFCEQTFLNEYLKYFDNRHSFNLYNLFERSQLLIAIEVLNKWISPSSGRYNGAIC